MNSPAYAFVVPDASALLPVEVIALACDPMGASAVVIARAINSPEPFAIPVGLNDARSIRAQLDGIEFELPTTHQLLVTTLERSGSIVETIALVGLRGPRVIARLSIRNGRGHTWIQECRASDALAMAVVGGAPLVATALVIEELSARHREQPIPWSEADVVKAPGLATKWRS